ncbi:Low molecular weight protein tyrosine phosphatase [hydrothermal vent metagenome]|uniref:protein-tyrosine-phosphatase n=1 Tax=hydrothermal vent metagenome TaxID=652676 RepID=A0A3B0SJ19_9ZZZZ
MTQSVLFVCLGNICRSPLAEAAFRQECARVGVNIVADSAGTGDWHVDQAPDERAIAVAAKNGVDIGHLRARQVTANDFRDFDHIIALDNQNMIDLKAIEPNRHKAVISLLFDHLEGREGQDAADPYYGKDDAFDETWAEVTEAAKVLVAKLGSAPK